MKWTILPSQNPKYKPHTYHEEIQRISGEGLLMAVGVYEADFTSSDLIVGPKHLQVYPGVRTRPLKGHKGQSDITNLDK